MGLGFLVPAFLAGLAALAIPLLLHLRHRDRDRPYRFPSLMFLEQLPIRTAKRQRITDWPLLLLRALAVSLLALAFARPVFTNQAAVATDARSRAVVILLDRSQSMGATGVWTAARDSARAIVRALRPRDRVGVVLFDDAAEVAQRLTEDHAAALAALDAAKPLARGTGFAPAVRVARQLLLDAPFAAAEIVLVSDLQRAGLTGMAGLDLPAGVVVRAVAVSPSTRRNVAIRSVEAKRMTVDGRSMMAVKARIMAHADSAITPETATAGHTVSLTLNGREAGSRRQAVASAGETVVAFPPVAAPEGPVAGVVTIAPAVPEANGHSADDQFTFVVPRDDPLRVLLMLPADGGGSEPYFLDKALGIGQSPAIRVTRASRTSITAAQLRTHDLLLLWDVAPSKALEAPLAAFVDSGGGVVQLVGRRLSTRGAAATVVPVTMEGTADRLADRGGAVRIIRSEHPLFAPFRSLENPWAGTQLFRYPRLSAPSNTDILARFDDGQPAILEKVSGAGRALLVAIPLDAIGGTFPLSPTYLPFVRQLVSYASGRDALPLWRSTAERWALPDTLRDPVVRTPGGTLLRPAADAQGAVIPLADAGLYSAFAGSTSGAAAALMAVNVPPSESELVPIDTTELLLGVRRTARSDSLPSAPPTNAELERRQNPWRLLLFLVAALLAGETFLSTRGWRAVARRTRPVSTDLPAASRSTI